MSAVLKDLHRVVREDHHVTLPTGEINVKVYDSPFKLNELIGFAARSNAKRGFLFLSKVLGKHWPTKPRLMADIQSILAAKIPANIPGPVVFIAMAETAIGLGQGVFEVYLKDNPNRSMLFLHTSRYQVGQAPIIEFEEAHSHAPRQFLHLPQDTALLEILLSAKMLVLVDDEASTGNTFLSLTAACRALNPGINKIHLATITNFMGPAVTDGLSMRFGLDVTIGAALSGEYWFCPKQVPIADGPAQLFQERAECGASGNFGRLGLDRALTSSIELAERLAANIQPGEKVLVLGTGEFMHPAFLLARNLDECGIDVVVQSSTRSPILQWGAVSHAITFPDNYKEGIANYIYNVAPAQYAHIFICHETPPCRVLHQLALSLHARLFYFQSENQVEEISIC